MSFRKFLGAFGILLVVIFSGTAFADMQTLAYLQELYEGPRFIKDLSGIITDRKSGLDWLEGEDKEISWKTGQKWIAGLGAGWRTPTQAELKTLYVQNGGGSASGNMDRVFSIAARFVWSGKGIKPDSIFLPQNGAFYFNYIVEGGAFGSKLLYKGDANLEGARVLAVRNK